MPNDFTPPPEELKRLADEIGLLRRDYQSSIAVLGRMEKRLKASFPAYTPKKQSRTQSTGGLRLASAKTADELNADFDLLLAATKERGDAGFEAAIALFPDADVIAIAHQVGIGSLKTTSVRKAREGVRKRIQESLLLSYERKSIT